LRKRQEIIVRQIIEWEHLPQIKVREFESGVILGLKHKDPQFDFGKYLSPLVAILLALAIFVLIKGIAWGSEGFPTESVIILLDLSGSSLSKDYKGEEEFQKNLKVIPEIIKQLKPNTFLRVIAIKEMSFGKPFIIIEGLIPAERGVFNEKEAKAKLSLIKCWEKLKPEKANFKRTDIFGSLVLASNLFTDKDGITKIIIILSDMRECGREFDLEKPASIDIKILEKIKDSGLIPSLKGVKIWVLGVHSSGKTEVYWKTLKEFWLRYFEQAGANIISYSMDRRWNNEQGIKTYNNENKN